MAVRDTAIRMFVCFSGNSIQCLEEPLGAADSFARLRIAMPKQKDSSHKQYRHTTEIDYQWQPPKPTDAVDRSYGQGGRGEYPADKRNQGTGAPTSDDPIAENRPTTDKHQNRRY